MARLLWPHLVALRRAARLVAGFGGLGAVWNWSSPRAGVDDLCAIAWRARAVALLLVFDATLDVCPAERSATRLIRRDRLRRQIEFLRHNLGLQRFYTLGPIAPNYVTYFGIASINHNYLPVPRLWTDWVAAHLDSAADPIKLHRCPFPLRPAATERRAEELRRNLAAYEEVGVKYLIAPAGEDPVRRGPRQRGRQAKLRRPRGRSLKNRAS